MRNRITSALLLVLSVAPALQAQGKAGDLGLGIVIGDATGPTLKYFTSDKTALDVGLGFSSDFKVYADYVWHSWEIFPRPQKGLFGTYLGLGPRFEERDNEGRKGKDKDDQFGVRTMGGIDYWIEEVPIELFLEAGPWFILSPDTDTEIDFGIGARYYFGGPSRPPRRKLK